MTAKTSASAVDQVKKYIAPALISIVAMFIWRDLNEVRNDVKQLLAQSSADHSKIIALDEDVTLLKQRLFYLKPAGTTYIPTDDARDLDYYTKGNEPVYAIKEDEFKLKAPM